MFRTPTALLCTLMFAACDAPQPSQMLGQPSPKGGQLSGPTQSLPSGGGLQPVATPQTGTSVAPPNAPSGAVVDQFAVSFLNSIQTRSIRERREYCGYITVDASGQLSATPPRPGTFAGCDMPIPRAGQGIIASYHTHGAYGPGYDNEVPSTVDLMSDFQFGIDGYVSTPGGRVWLVDVQTRSTRQICGLRCVISDPGFVPEGEATIQASYTLPALERRSNGF